MPRFILLFIIMGSFRPLPGQTLKEREAASEARIAPDRKYFDSLRWREPQPKRFLFDTLYKRMMKEIYIDFYACFRLYQSVHGFTTDSVKLFMSRLPENARNGLAKLNDYYVQKLYESQHPHLKSTYPVDLPLPGQPLTTATVITPLNKKEATSVAKTSRPAGPPPTTATTTKPGKKDRLSLEMRGQIPSKIGKVYLVKGYSNNYRNATDNKVYFYATHADQEYMYGITVYHVHTMSGGYAERSDEVRLSGMVMSYEKQFVDHDQFWNPRYSTGTTCSKNLRICSSCHGSGNGLSRNTKRPITKVSTTPGSSYGKKLTYDQVFYDYYPCKGCKGKGWLND